MRMPPSGSWLDAVVCEPVSSSAAESHPIKLARGETLRTAQAILLIMKLQFVTPDLTPGLY